MHRFFVEEPLTEAGQLARLGREESEHAARVLRLRPGEGVCLMDGERLCAATLADVDAKAVTARVDAFLPSTEPPARAYLVQGLPKADKLEWIVQKATELGAHAVLPVTMERCVARADAEERGERKRERLRRIALEAAKQSGRAHVPGVEPVRPLAETLERLREAEPELLALAAWEEERALPLSRAVREHISAHGLPPAVAVIVGPEGGVSPEEHARLVGLGAASVTLGPRILRTETAGLCALAALWAALGEM